MALKDFNLTVELPNLKLKVEQLDVNELLNMIKINSNIPQGSGLGSSAALSVAISRALSLNSTNENIFEIAKKFDDQFHDGSSGIDTFTICHSGLCRLKNGTSTFEKLPPNYLEKLRKFKFSIIDTGICRKTKEIKSKIDKNDYFNNFLPVISEICKGFTKLLESTNEQEFSLESISSLFNRSQEALYKLKVSTDLIQNIIKHLISIFPSIGIKISGGGGGGCLLLVHNEFLCETALKYSLKDFLSVRLYYDIKFNE